VTDNRIELVCVVAPEEAKRRLNAVFDYLLSLSQKANTDGEGDVCEAGPAPSASANSAEAKSAPAGAYHE